MNKDINFLKKHKGIIKCFLIFMLFYFIDYTQLIFIKLFNIEYVSGQLVVVLNTMKNILLLLALVLIYWKELKREWKIFKENFLDNLDTGIKCWFVGLAVMMISNLIINLVFKGGGANNEETVQAFISYLPWMMLINAGFIAPFTEEMVFRKSFKDAFKNKWLFIILSGLVFGAMHVIGNVEVWTDILFIIPYGFLGGAFAYAYYETDTVFTSFTLHMLHNTILILLSGSFL